MHSPSPIDWGSYEVFDPDVDRPLGELTRAEAKSAYVRLMDAKSQRLDVLVQLLERNGVDPGDLSDVDHWFSVSVEPNPDLLHRLANRWYGVVNDIGLYLGDLSIWFSGGSLRWEFFTKGRRSSGYQRHVVVGFDVPNPSYYVDFDLAVSTYGHRIIAGLPVRDNYFTRMFAQALSQA